MTQIPSAGNLPLVGQDTPGDVEALRGLEMEDFLQLMISELQNQDPLNPLENSEMLQQISQIREIGATQRLSDTLETVLLGQNIASATNLIGKQVRAVTDAGSPAQGTVHQVTIIDGEPKLHLDGKTTATADSTAGEIEEGTYRYKVVLGDTQPPMAVEVGPVQTTGTALTDQSILLRNLPLGEGMKSIYRTHSSGDGDYYLVGHVDGEDTSFLDTLPDSELRGGTLPADTVPLAGGRKFTVSLSNVSEIRR